MSHLKLTEKAIAVENQLKTEQRTFLLGLFKGKSGDFRLEFNRNSSRVFEFIEHTTSTENIESIIVNAGPWKLGDNFLNTRDNVSVFYNILGIGGEAIVFNDDNFDKIFNDKPKAIRLSWQKRPSKIIDNIYETGYNLSGFLMIEHPSYKSFGPQSINRSAIA